MMRFMTALLFVALASSALAQGTRYISDEQLIPIRSGPGTEYRILHAGLPSGTRLELLRSDADSGWSEIRTTSGLQGWMLTRYLISDKPATVQLAEVSAELQQHRTRADALTAERNALQTQLETLRGELGSNLESLDSTAEELERIQQLSGNAVQLDQQNRRLIEEVELMHTSIEMLEAENRRLQDTRDQEAFMNGAMAVLLGVVIALVVPRLWPRRRRDSGWA